MPPDQQKPKPTCDASCVRDNKLTDLRHQSIIEQVGGYVLFLLGDLVIATGKKYLLDWLEIIVDIGALVVSNILPLLANWNGGSLSASWYGAMKWLMWGLTAAEGVIAAIREGNWWLKTGAQLVGQTIRAAAGGPLSVIGSVLWMFVAPILGNLLDVGGHALLAKGFADYEDYSQESAMPIQTWCAQYGGCPASTS